MSRSAIALAVTVIVSLGIANEQAASACPNGPSAAARAPRSNATRAGHVLRTAHAPRNARTAPEPAPLPAPAAPSASSSTDATAYNVDRINAYRRSAGLAPVTLDPTLSSFARAGSTQLMRDHVPHGHFRGAGDSLFRQGFNGGAAENQGSPTGWPRASNDAAQNERRQIDQILASMMSEGSGGGHFRNMMNPKAKRVGVGLVEDADGKLYLTNDFSE